MFHEWFSDFASKNMNGSQIMQASRTKPDLYLISMKITDIWE